MTRPAELRPSDITRRMGPQAVLADLLPLAATPVFAGLALVTQLTPPDAAALICGTGPSSMPTDMAAMYALMAVFHAPPWLRLRRRQDPPLLPAP